MSLNAAVLKLMANKGLSAHDIAQIAEAMEGARDSAADRRRAWDRERKAEKRAEAKVLSGGKSGGNPPDPSPNEIDILTPTRENSEPNGSSKKSAWPCPADVDADHWRDFLKNRRTKHLTNSETAYRGQLRALAELSDDEWPPGRLVQHAAEKGWGSINDPRTPKHGTPASNIASLRGHRPDPALDLLRSARAAEDREDRWGAGPSLPAIGTG